MSDESPEIANPVEEAAEKPKRRGRPRKNPLPEDGGEGAAPAAEETSASAPKRRGRPRKNPLPEAEAPAAASDAKADGASGSASNVEAATDAAPKRRGRPRKNPLPEEAPAVSGASDASEEKPAPAPAAEADRAADAEDAGGQPVRKSVHVQGQNAKQRRQQQNKQGGQNNQNRQNQNQNNNRNRQNNNQQNRNNKQQNNNRNNRFQRRQHNQNREVVPSVTREDLAALKVAELREKAAALDLDVKGLKKAELVEAVFEASVKAEGFIEVEGVLDILSDGYGFLRTSGYLPGESDCYVGAQLIRRNGLRKGDRLKGQTRPARENEKFAAIQRISQVNGHAPEEMTRRVKFGDLTPVYPDECLVMEHGKNAVTARVIDLVSPIGKGQRGLIVSPPKAGKTTILKDIAAAISANNPEVHLMCLLVDERPEEVTDMERSIHGEVISSTFDMPTENHIAVAELVIERAKRLVEDGKDVVILLDSITRLARAYNLAQPASGRILSGGVDSTALYPPKRFLGAARNIEHGGSLTILASALVDTGSKMDEVIFEEFKGTGNMELKLDRNLADRRIFPAIDPVASGTRKEELLLKPQEAPLIWAVRRILANTNSTERSMDMLIKSLKQTDDNQEFLVRTAKKAQHTKAEAITEF